MWRASRNLTNVGSAASTARTRACTAQLCTQTSKSETATKPAEAKAAPTETKAAPAEQKAKATPPPPQEPRRSGGIFWKVMGLTLVGAGGAVGYAWYDPNFRKQIEDNIPYSKDGFQYLMKYLPESPQQAVLPTPKDIGAGPIVTDIEAVKKQGLAKTSVTPKPPVEKSKTPSTPQEVAQEKKVEAKALAAKKKEEVKVAAEAKKQQAKDLVKQKQAEKEIDSAAENSAIEAILRSTIADANKAITAAIEAQKVAAQSTRKHAQLLKKAMDEAEKLETSKAEALWKEVTAAHEMRAKATAQAEKLTTSGRLQLQKVQSTVAHGRENQWTKKNKHLISAEESITKLTYNLGTAVAETAKAQSQAKVMTNYRDLIKKGKEQFRKELESIMPDVKIGRRLGDRMTEEELNSLIAHAHRRIEQLQRQLAEQMALEQNRMEDSLERQREEDDKLADERVLREMEKMKNDFQVEKLRWEVDARVEFEQELREQLKRQAGAHSDHLAEVLKVQEQEFEESFNLLLEEKLVQARDKFHQEVADSVARLRGIEAAVEGRAELEKQGRKAQELWLACQALFGLIQEGRDGAKTWEGQLKPLASELLAVKEAGNNHPFVNSIIQTVPDEAILRGVWTEDALVERFDKVRIISRRVAMIDESGGTLFKYFLSFCQSMFVVTPSKTLTDKDEVKPEDMGTFLLLDNAARSLDKGDLEQAVRYMNQLQGAPRKVAADWLKEARLHLETRQAAAALLAHASASGLGSIF